MPNSTVLLIARRFLKSQSADGFFSLITKVSVVGVALGVLALTVVLSVINGFEGELIRVITGMNGDVVLYTRGDPVPDSDKIRALLKKWVPGPFAVTPSFVAEMMVSGPSGVAGVVLEGIELSTAGKVTRVQDSVTQGRLPATVDEVALGASLAQRIGAQEGSEVRLVLPSLGSVTEPPKAMKVRVVGIIRMGMYEYDSKFLYMMLPAIQSFVGQAGKVTTFKLKLLGGQDARKVADRVSDGFGYPFRAKDWGQLNRNLFYAIKLEKAVISVILTVIIFVAAFNVVCTLMMMIHDKTREVAILKAMGLRWRQSFAVFSWIGLVIGIVGTSIGLGMGLVSCWVLSKVHWIDLPADIYYIDTLPVVVRPREVGAIAAFAIVMTWLATLYPAVYVSNRSPMDGLKQE